MKQAFEQHLALDFSLALSRADLLVALPQYLVFSALCRGPEALACDGAGGCIRGLRLARLCAGQLALVLASREKWRPRVGWAY